MLRRAGWLAVAACGSSAPAARGPAPPPPIEASEPPAPSTICYAGEVEDADGGRTPVALSRSIEPDRSRVVEIRSYRGAPVDPREVLIYSTDGGQVVVDQGNGIRLGRGTLTVLANGATRLDVELDLNSGGYLRVVVEPGRYGRDEPYVRETLREVPCDQVHLIYVSPPTW